MSLADRVTAPPPRRGGLPCSLGTLLASLETAERHALQQMLDSHRWTEPMIHDALTAEGHNVSRTSVGHHRRGNCRCPKGPA